jgi:hypothetical protein
MTGYSDELRRGLDIVGGRRPCMMPLTGSIGLDSLSNSVHIFIVRLKGQDTCFDHCQAMLNEQELHRASFNFIMNICDVHSLFRTVACALCWGYISVFLPRTLNLDMGFAASPLSRNL